MRRLFALAVFALAMLGCGAPPTAGSMPSEVDSAEIMATALSELITKDHTFGQGPPPFNEFLIEVRTVPITLAPTEESPDAVERSSDTRRPLTESERSAIEEAVSEYGPLRWIDDPDEWRVGFDPKIEGSVILGVGEPRLDDEGALVPVSLWCGGTCGTWFTYRLEPVDDEWRVTGKEGPVAIS